jgi:FkbM family methyltransferase
VKEGENSMLEVSYENFLELLSKNSTPEKIIENDSATQEAFKQIQNGSKIYIWPSGRIGRRIYEELTKNGYENLVLVDRNCKDLDNTIPPNDINFAESDVLIITTLIHSKEIYNLALAMGCKHILMYYHIKSIIEPVLFPDDFHDKDFEGLTTHLLDNADRYKRMYTFLEDNASKQNFLNNMFFRLTQDIRYTFEYDTKLQYFDEKIRFDSEDVIVDGGGYNGDTLEQFLKLNKPFKSYYLFEPDPVLLDQAKRVSDDPRIKYVNMGLFSRPDILRFNKTTTMNGDGQIVDDGSDTVDVTSIDSFIHEKVSFIKLDIEGAELEALHGSLNCILRNNPVLAICIYHKPSDYLDIFEFIQSLNPVYSFFIRHHEDFYAETVLYAIPKNKLKIKMDPKKKVKCF